MRWTHPTGATLFRLCLGPTAGLSDQANSAGVWGYRGASTERQYGVPTSGNCAVYESGTLTTSSTTGNLQMQWAQVAAHATATEVGSGSFLKYRRIA